MTTKFQNDATSAFISKVAQIREIAEKLIAKCDDHFGLSPDDIGWGNVAETEHVLNVLKEINFN